MVIAINSIIVSIKIIWFAPISWYVNSDSNNPKFIMDFIIKKDVNNIKPNV